VIRTSRETLEQTEVGFLPHNWETPLLDSVAKRGTGHTPDKAHPDYWNGNIKWVSLRDSDALDRVFLDDTAASITRAGIANSSAVVHPAGTVVVSRDAGVGKSAILKTSMAVSQHFMTWQCGPGLENTYLYYWLQSQKPEFERIAMGNTIKTIGVPYFRALRIVKPPLPEQRAIGKALFEADALLLELDALIAKKRDLKRAAMQQLLTGQMRLPGFCGNWKSHSLGQIADPRKQWSFAGGPFGSNLKSSDYTTDGVRIIQLQNIGDGEFRDEYAVYTSAHKAAELENCQIYPGEIIMSKMGDPVARACLVPAVDDRYLMCSDGIRLAVDEQRFDTNFVFYQINSPQFRTRADNAGTGSTRKRIGLAQLRDLAVACPPLTEQMAIAAVLSDMDAEIAALEVRREKIRFVKQAMMQELLTGRIRLI
jgi:type I restriction enzyme, S subunit